MRRRWVRGHRNHARTIAGVRFKAHLLLHSAWVTEDGFQVELYEGDGGGWLLFGYDPRGPVSFTTMRSAALEIARVRELIALHKEEKTDGR